MAEREGAKKVTNERQVNTGEVDGPIANVYVFYFMTKIILWFIFNCTLAQTPLYKNKQNE